MKIEKLDEAHPMMVETMDRMQKIFGVIMDTPEGYICIDDRRGGAMYKVMTSNPYRAYGHPGVILCTIAEYPTPKNMPRDNVCNDIRTLLGLGEGIDLQHNLPASKHLYKGIKRTIHNATPEMVEAFSKL